MSSIYKSCSSKTSLYMFNYIITIIFFIILGILYETKKINRKFDFENKFIWWHSALVALIFTLLLVVSNIIIYFLKKNLKYKDFLYKYNILSNYWLISHFVLYFTLTLVSPGQWPFWMALGLAWEFIECYMFCADLYICNGIYDIMANIAGIFVALWISANIYN